MENLKELKAQKRELSAKMAEANAANDQAAFDTAKREYEMKAAQIADILQDEQARQLVKTPAKSKNQQWREVINGVRNHTVDGDFRITREVTSGIINTGDVNNMESAGLPLTINDLIEPLEMDLIYGNLGIKIATGVHGQIMWPYLDTVAEVTVAGETVELGDTNLDFSKITAVPQRVGISIAITNEAINDASFDLQGEVTSQIRKSLARALNKAVIGNTAIGQLVGPFASGNVEAVTFEGEMPTYKELLKMPGVVAGKGVQMSGFCYIMNTVTYFTLMATPITEGDSRTIIENGRIAGYPVFLTDSEKIADGCVYAGCFGYAALNQHGETHFIIDPYTAAKKNEVVFTLNADWSLTTLRNEAFVVGAGTSPNSVKTTSTKKSE